MKFCHIRKTKFRVVLIPYQQAAPVDYLELSVFEPIPLVTWTNGPDCYEESEFVTILGGPSGYEKGWC